MKDIIKEAFEIAMRSAVTGIVEKVIEDIFTVAYNDQKEGIKTSIMNMDVGALIDVVKQAFLDTILVWNVNRLATCIHFWDTLTRRLKRGSPLLCQSRHFLRRMLTR